MKKAILLAAMFGTIGSLNAQELRSKRGEYVLPEAGDYAIGIDATPFLQYFGNFFGKTTANSAPTWNFLTRNQTITGKYFVTPSMAYRATLRIGAGSDKQDKLVAQRGLASAPVYPTVHPTVTNTYKESNFNIGLSAGFEKRRGFTRLQGFYGAEVGLGVGSSKSSFSYGNALTNTTVPNPIGVAADDAFTGQGNVTTDSYGNVARITSRNNGTTIEFGVRGFIGAEYFVLPKISVGGEFGWGAGISRVGNRSTTLESVGTAGSVSTVGTQQIDAGSESSFAIDTDNVNSILGPSGTLRINLHF